MGEFVVDGVRYQVIDTNNKTFRVGNNTDSDSNAVVCEKLSKRLHLVETYAIENAVYHLEEISRYAFRGCKTLNTIIIPDSVLYLRYRAFDQSTLRKIIFSPNSRIKEFESGSLCGTKLTSISIPNTLSNIVYHCFAASVLRDVYYCGSYKFIADNFHSSKYPIALHLSSSNSIESLGENFSIAKSSTCTLPKETLYCTSKFPCRKNTLSALISIITIIIWT